jgi:hypothetical protein
MIPLTQRPPFGNGAELRRLLPTAGGLSDVATQVVGDLKSGH